MKKIFAIGTCLLLFLFLVSCMSPSPIQESDSDSSTNNQVEFDMVSSSTPPSEEAATDEEEVDFEEVDFCPPISQEDGSANWRDFWGKASQISLEATPELVFVAEKGTPVYSPVSGTVIEIQRDVIWPSGRSIKIQCSDDLQIELSHLDSIDPLLKIGDSVDNSLQVGVLGVTGNAKKPVVGVGAFKKDDTNEFHRVNLDQWNTLFANWSEEYIK